MKSRMSRRSVAGIFKTGMTAESKAGDMGTISDGSKNRTPLIEPFNHEFEGIQTPLEVFDLVESKNYNPYLYRLSEVKWDIFGTLTWAHDALQQASFSAETRRKTDFQNLMNQVSRTYKIRHKNLVYFRSTELSPAGSAHYHFVISKNGIQRLKAPEVAAFIGEYWSDAKRGTSDIKAFEDDDSGYEAVKYCCKPDYRNFNDEKFDSLSKGLIRLLKKLPPQQIAC